MFVMEDIVAPSLLPRSVLVLGSLLQLQQDVSKLLVH